MGTINISVKDQQTGKEVQVEAPDDVQIKDFLLA